MCLVSDKVTHNCFKESQNPMRESLKMDLYKWWKIITLQIGYVRVELGPIQILKWYKSISKINWTTTIRSFGSCSKCPILCVRGCVKSLTLNEIMPKNVFIVGGQYLPYKLVS